MTNCRETAAITLSRPQTARADKLIYRALKRTSDFLLSLAAIILLAVPMLIIALLIRIDSPGPALFRQYRVGRNGKLFRICKFRTMYCSAPSETATGDLECAYSYITKIGVFLRKTSLDELPQLFNILRGDMSLIGPRPLIAGESEIHSLRDEANVYSVRPGMTGWAQVNGRDCLTVEEKVALDAEYIEKMSLPFDVRVILKTVSVVLSGEGFAEGKQSDAQKCNRETDTPSA